MACYNRTAREKSNNSSTKNRKLLDLLNGLDIRIISEPQLRSADPQLKTFTNINTDQDLLRARTLIDPPPENPAS